MYNSKFAAGVGLAALAAGITFTAQLSATAGDAADAPATQADPAADLSGLYTWVQSSRYTAILTFAPLAPAGGQASFDRDVLYTIHIDTNSDNEADRSIHFRFAQNALGDWGVQAENIPGLSGPMAGPVETVLEDSTVQLFAGFRDDPFFMDAIGMNDTLATSTLAFTAEDFFAGRNVSALVIEFPVASLNSQSLRSWATSARTEVTP